MGRGISGALLCVMLAAAHAGAEEKTAEQVIAELVAQFSGKSAAKRTLAAKKLGKLDGAALPQIRKAFAAADAAGRRRMQSSLPWATCPAWATFKRRVPIHPVTLLPTVVVDKKTKMEFVLIPAGEFMMGTSPGDTEAQPGDDFDPPARKVKIERALYVGKFEVTTDQWLAVLGTKPELARKGNFPVVGVSWKAIQPFLQKTGFRLPTEEEWEFACRAGTATARYGKLEEIAWHGGNVAHTLGVSPVMPVGGKKPNLFGLFDMLGNAWEWTSTSRGETDTDEREQKRGAAAREHFRVLRGGGAGNGRTYWLRASVAAYQIESYTNSDLGFRVVRTAK